MGQTPKASGRLRSSLNLLKNTKIFKKKLGPKEKGGS